MTLGIWWDPIILYLVEGILSSFGIFRQKYMLFSGLFSSNFFKSKWKWLPSFNKTPRNSLHHVLIVHKNWKSKRFEKHLLCFGFYDKNSQGEVNKYTSSLLFPGIALKRHTFNIKHYKHKSYLHIKVHFGLHSTNETTQKKYARSLL